MRRAWGVVATAVFALGCGSGGPELPVNGIVTMDERPLDGATVIFYPETGGKPGAAVTGSDGKFVIVGLQRESGLAPGKYKVTVSKMKFYDEPPVGAITEVDTKNDLAPIYSNPAQTILSYSVTGDGKPIEIKLSSKRKK